MERFDRIRSEAKQDEVSDTAAWISGLAPAGEVQGRMKFYGFSKEAAIEQTLTAQLDNPKLDGAEYKRLAALRDGFITVAYDKFSPDQRDFYQEMLDTTAGVGEVTDQLRQDLAALLACHEIELPEASLQNGLIRTLLSPETIEE